MPGASEIFERSEKRSEIGYSVDLIVTRWLKFLPKSFEILGKLNGFGFESAYNNAHDINKH